MLALLAPVGCKRKKHAQADDQPAGLATMVNAADARTSAQLVRGFYDVEQNAWRWTGPSFAAKLRTPSTAAQKGAMLELKFTVPEVVTQKVGAVTLSASVNGQKLTPETYPKSGEYTYSRDIPASALQGESATVEFTLDKYMPGTAQDVRDLGVIVTMIGFEVKP